jgi:aspartyl-tRNA(Asn)/glutamyl-tRNA(Gln) amidotransferase subunit C
MITIEEVKKISKLTKLDFSQEQMLNLAGELTEIMNMINILNELECAEIEPLTSVCDRNQRLRQDGVLSNDISGELFTNLSGDQAELAKEIKCFVVPKVVE